MKNTMFKTSFLTIGLFIALLPAFTSCKKDQPEPTLKDQVVGEWLTKSFTIDGVEVVGSVITYSKMEFKAYSGQKGDFEWAINYADGSSEHQTGDYTMDNTAKEVELINNSGERLKFDVTLNGDKLELSGNIEGEYYVLKANRD